MSTVKGSDAVDERNFTSSVSKFSRSIDFLLYIKSLTNFQCFLLALHCNGFVLASRSDSCTIAMCNLYLLNENENENEKAPMTLDSEVQQEYNSAVVAGGGGGSCATLHGMGVYLNNWCDDVKSESKTL